MSNLKLKGEDKLPQFDSIRFNSTCADSHFVCSGNPGTGFYFRDNKSLEGLFPMPLSLFPNLEKTTKTINQTVDNPAALRRPVPKPGCGAAFFMVFIYGFFWIVGLILAQPDSLTVFLPWFLGILGCIIFEAFRRRYYKKKNKADSVIVVTSKTQVDWSMDVPYLDNVSDYYINTANQTICNLPDGYAKSILQNYVACISDPKMSSHFEAEAGLSSRQLDLFKNLCVNFESLFNYKQVFSLDFFQHFSENDNEPDSVSLGKAALYVGVFDFISSQFDIPVMDFGMFQLYIYPKFLLKVYDPFSFEVCDYKDIKFISSVAKIDEADLSPSSTDSKVLSGKNSKVFKLPYFGFEIGGKTYSIVLDQDLVFVNNFKKAMNQYIAAV